MYKYLFIMLIVLGLPDFSHAGGPLFYSYSGAPSRWDNSHFISLHPESGSCSGVEAGAMAERLGQLAEIWSGLDGVDINLVIEEGEIDLDIDGANYGSYIPFENGSTQSLASSTDDINPVIFDEDGEVMAAIAGEINRYALLGMASPSGLTDDYLEIYDGWMLINCRCFLDASDPDKPLCDGELYDEDMRDAVILHELGHFLNLDHSQVNEDTVTNDALSPGDLPTMYPYLEFPVDQLIPQTDDRMALAQLYSADDLLDQTCVITGSLVDEDGLALRCADVQAVADDAGDTVAVVSGNTAVSSDNNGDGDDIDAGECESGCGDFSLTVIKNKNYTITIKPINTALSGYSGLGPCKLDPVTTIVEEVVATVRADECIAGATLDLGALETASTGGVEEIGTDDDADSGSDAGNGSGAAAGCALRLSFP